MFWFLHICIFVSYLQPLFSGRSFAYLRDKFVDRTASNAEARGFTKGGSARRLRLDDMKVLLFSFQGGRNVLCLYGYSNQQPDGLSFPDDVIDPDVGRVAAVTLEVMSLRMELEMLIKV